MGLGRRLTGWLVLSEALHRGREPARCCAVCLALTVAQERITALEATNRWLRHEWRAAQQQVARLQETDA